MREAGDEVLLAIVVPVHVAAGLTAVVTGVVAMSARKRVGRHPRFGRIYLLALTVTTTAAVLAIARPHAAFLLILGAVALTAAVLGLLARRIRWQDGCLTARRALVVSGVG